VTKGYQKVTNVIAVVLLHVQPLCRAWGETQTDKTVGECGAHVT